MAAASVLFLVRGPALIHGMDFFRDKYDYLGKHLSGHIILFAPKRRVQDYAQEHALGSFSLTKFCYQMNGFARWITTPLLMILESLRLRFLTRKRFDVVVAPDPLVTGLVAEIVATLTGSKSIIEVNGNFESAFKFGKWGGSKAGVAGTLKELVSRSLIRFVLSHASHVKLVYHRQLEPLGLKNQKQIPISSFPNYVAIKQFIGAEKSHGKYVLSLGFPWYLKGFDLLIKAFLEIEQQFPEYRLKLVGYMPEGKEHLEQLAKGHPRIEMPGPVYYKDVIALMANCSIYALASRTDSSPRVLREAMASGKPIIASRIDGVPELIKDGYNGLLFKTEDHLDLADKMRQILLDDGLAKRLADNGLSFVRQKLSEECYAENFRHMVESVIGRDGDSGKAIGKTQVTA